MLLFKLSVKSIKSTIFKFEAISIRRPSNLNAVIIFCILEVLCLCVCVCVVCMSDS